MTVPDAYIPTGIGAFDRLVGGMPTGSLIGIYGPPSVGKSTLLLQLAFAGLRNGGNAMIVDTEGNLATIRGWHARFAKLYGIEPDVVPVDVARDAKTGRVGLSARTPFSRTRPTIQVARVPTISKLLAVHGRPHLIGISDKDDRPVARKDQLDPAAVKAVLKKGGKFVLRPLRQGWVDESLDAPLAQWCRRNKVTFLAYDSLTWPLKEFGSERQNLPARSSATSMVLIAARELVEDLDLLAGVIAHETKDPSLPWSPALVSGGNAVLYSLKYVVRMTKFRTGRKERITVNELQVRRHADRLDDDAARARIRLTLDRGFVDADDDADAPPEPAAEPVPEEAPHG